jgi:hypothetical protein
MIRFKVRSTDCMWIAIFFRNLHLLNIWNIDLTQIQQYHENLVTLRGGHIQEG